MGTSASDYRRQLDCTYDNEHYLVRDNGAVLRRPRDDKRKRAADELWTFGDIQARTGYLVIASVRVHRIVATAFHGTAPTPQHVVDHIDTNRRNNRPENLRWVTRLENILLNPITAKRIEFSYGSIEEFLSNPQKQCKNHIGQEFEWIRTVTIDEARVSYHRLLEWAKADKQPVGQKLGDWIFNRKQQPRATALSEAIRSEILNSHTEGAAQRNWRVPSFFPSCMELSISSPLADYASRLQVGTIFAYSNLNSSTVSETSLSDDQNTLWVLCDMGDDAIKSWSLAEVTVENDVVVHTNLGSFFERRGAERKLCECQGLEWKGGGGIDDDC